MIRVAIIEDEPATGRNLAHLLHTNDVEVVCVLNSIQTSVQWLRNNQAAIDLLFMDIRLSDGLCFEIFNDIVLTKPVVFVTAYNDYALKAFKANGIDYILKPFDEDEVGAALKKFTSLQTAGNSSQKDMLEVMQYLRAQKSFKKSFLVHYREKLIPLYANEIFWICSENETLHAYTSQHKSYILDGTLEKLQNELDPSQFFRANRQFIINRAAIVEVNFYFNGRLSVKVTPESPQQILVSKARVPEFREWMNT
jgi:two-component system LytT family response regulator